MIAVIFWPQHNDGHALVFDHGDDIAAVFANKELLLYGDTS